MWPGESNISGSVFDIPEKELRIRELEKESLRDIFWDEPERASGILREKSRLTDAVEKWKQQKNGIEDLRILYEIASEENDDQTREEIRSELERLNASVRVDELKMMLGSEQDPMNAILSIHAGAGGTEAQDWAEMLLRMYLRWAERKGLDTTIIDYLPGDEAGIKSVTLTLRGEYAFGFAKAEIGIHRLVRISPFDAGARRHTSFASVFVYPEVDDRIVIEIDEKDLRIDTYRSSGAGGQHVNKTDSAVRLTHLPTGIVVQCQNERSQHKNKAMAMKYLRSRIYEMKLREQNEKLDEINKTKKDIAWGSQIRSYVLHPYRMVKDHRTNLETGNVNRVLDGDIDDFIEAYLLH
ncbi:MAG: peptide chain release factor 2 [Proteobacteria bacterium]|nr:peptide chain release factor 2 [Pseudomonadota bacterium]MBU1744717.1 peptide chain release factor 2 [Pseudomonadota bacterium]MBU1965223.1 peptide chain release factor 2 [Pseudomonadota bacterium]MBU4370777.1 peptide chain release factor 2 [Pseudomonadota bacterium]MBU4581087.1 peptide chain release factor 2 [Pseudomonadota bacterium]